MRAKVVFGRMGASAPIFFCVFFNGQNLCTKLMDKKRLEKEQKKVYKKDKKKTQKDKKKKKRTK
jgi:hypothetical protein